MIPFISMGSQSEGKIVCILPYQLAFSEAIWSGQCFLKMSYLGSEGQGFTMVPSNLCHETDH